jgi:riboflavin synthase
LGPILLWKDIFAMFTGIVEFMGTIESLEHTAEGGRLVVRAPEVIAVGLAVANSIAVNGCCLTVVECDAETFAADLSGETLRRTSFGEMKAGTRVNLEKPLTAGKEFGGHFVQGHVDGVGRVTRLVPEGENWWLGVRVPEELWRYVAMKGSIAFDGISLTVAGWKEGVVDIAIIPFTYTHTNVQELKAGDAVNLECDVLAKYVERLMQAREEAAGTKLTLEKLVEHGF